MTLLKNERVALRAPEPEDLDFFYRWENDTELWKYGAAVSPYSRYALKQYLADATHDIYRQNQLRLMIVENAGGSVAGTVDLYDFDPHHNRAGVGILVDREFRRKGVGSAALDSMAEYAFSFLHLHQLFAHVPVLNTPSLALFEKNGFVAAGLLRDWLCTDEGYADVCVMQRVVR